MQSTFCHCRMSSRCVMSICQSLPASLQMNMLSPGRCDLAGLCIDSYRCKLQHVADHKDYNSLNDILSYDCTYAQGIASARTIGL